MYNIGVVSYLNAKPLIYYIEDFAQKHHCKIIYAYPAKLGELFSQKKLDLALLPVIHLLHEPMAKPVSKYCIGAEGEVASVGLLSNEPIEHISKVYLDYQSNTSNALAKLLLSQYWHLQPEYVLHAHDLVEKTEKNAAHLLIGDRALRHKKSFTYYYDLATAWQAMTGTSFVFAAWISQSAMDATLMKDFDEMQARGLEQIDTIIDKTPFLYYDLHIYYKRNISNLFDTKKQAGLSLFLRSVSSLTTLKKT